jgi:hypothetical protein
VATRLWFDYRGRVYSLTDQQALDRITAGQFWQPVPPIHTTSAAAAASTPKEHTMSAAATAKRQVIDHSSHDHPATSKARAACRAALAEAAAQAAAKKPAAKKSATTKTD